MYTVYFRWSKLLIFQVVGYKLTGAISSYATSTDVVLTITKVRMVKHSIQLCIYIFSVGTSTAQKRAKEGHSRGKKMEIVATFVEATKLPRVRVLFLCLELVYAQSIIIDEGGE